MIFPHRTVVWLIVALVMSVVIDPSEASGQTEQIISRAVQFLKTSGIGGQAGETALAALAMIKAEVPASDPALVLRHCHDPETVCRK